ncbi:MAG: hypothetical protein AAF685_03385 [Cyanobacteria bacterium P01_C01_bin.89]
MAKRRNLKKEKAQRNLAYARKFRKRSTGRNNRGRRPPMNNDADNEKKEEEDGEKTTANQDA